MGFWIFMLIMDLVIPCSMIGFGRYYIKNVPKKDNAVFGYRTTMSKRNSETWAFAHRYIGRIWYTCGLVLLPMTSISMLFVLNADMNRIGIFGGVLCEVQLIPFVGAVFLTERALKKSFDKNGSRR